MSTCSISPPEHAMTHYAVSKVKQDNAGRVTDVFWGQVNTSTNAWTTQLNAAPVSDVVDAIHNGDIVFALFPTLMGLSPERRFEAVAHVAGAESIALEGNATFKFELADMARLEQ